MHSLTWKTNICQYISYLAKSRMCTVFIYSGNFFICTNLILLLEYSHLCSKNLQPVQLNNVVATINSYNTVMQHVTNKLQQSYETIVVKLSSAVSRVILIPVYSCICCNSVCNPYWIRPQLKYTIRYVSSIHIGPLHKQMTWGTKICKLALLMNRSGLFTWWFTIVW